jgi:hypothetical protein
VRVWRVRALHQQLVVPLALVALIGSVFAVRISPKYLFAAVAAAAIVLPLSLLWRRDVDLSDVVVVSDEIELAPFTGRRVLAWSFVPVMVGVFLLPVSDDGVVGLSIVFLLLARSLMTLKSIAEYERRTGLTVVYRAEPWSFRGGDSQVYAANHSTSAA